MRLGSDKMEKARGHLVYSGPFGRRNVFEKEEAAVTFFLPPNYTLKLSSSHSRCLLTGVSSESEQE